MLFYAHPTDLISPGDVFPKIPVSISVPPLRIARKSKFSPPAKFGPQELRRIYTIPEDSKQLADLRIEEKQGEETLVTTRVGPVLFLSWGSQVEGDERDIMRKGKAQNKGWLGAPIYSLHDVPEQATIEDPDTHESIPIRAVIRDNASHNYFYLPPFPGTADGKEHYVDFRKISVVGVEFFRNSRSSRLATLSEETLNLLFSRLMWFFTRAEYFFRPISCVNCGERVPIDIRFEGQNLDAEPWE